MNVMNYGKCRDLSVKWEYSKLHGLVCGFGLWVWFVDLVYESWIWQQWNAPPAAETDALISSVSVK